MAQSGVARSETDVLVAGDQSLLCELVDGLLRHQGFRLSDDIADSPKMMERVARGLAAIHTHQVGVLVDPIGEAWVEAARKLRSGDPKLGLIVITARANYAVQRRWQQRVNEQTTIANGLLSFDCSADDLSDAVEAARRRPRERSGFWLDGPRHPAAFHRTEEGVSAQRVRTKATLHETLVLEGRGESRVASARKLRIKKEQVGERLGQLRSLLGVRTDVQLGRRASELGLFDDVDY